MHDKIAIDSVKYNLFLKEEKFRNFTDCSFYFVSNKKKIKKSKPIDVNGYRKKLDMKTGEIRNYTFEEYQSSATMSVARSKHLIDLLLQMNDFDWFCTLTFDKEKINRYDDAEVYKSYVKYINNIKHKYPTFKYLTVLERHDEKSIHFHMLVAGLTWQQLGLVNSGKVCCHWATKKNGICNKAYFEKTKSRFELTETDGLIVYNITTFVDGFTTATRIASRERCNSYVKKYLDKALGSTDIFKKRFYYSSNLNIPDIVRRCVGADFTTPETLKTLDNDTKKIIENSANGVYYNSTYNIFKARLDNLIKENLEKGMIPTNEITPFD